MARVQDVGHRAASWAVPRQAARSAGHCGGRPVWSWAATLLIVATFASSGGFLMASASSVFGHFCSDST